MDEPERITLTQRRKEMTGASKLNRSKLERISDDMDDEKSGGAKSIVAWMVIIIAVSVAAYFGVTNYLDGQDATDDTTIAVEATPVPTAEDLLVSSTILADTLADDMQEEEVYTLDDQSVGEESTDLFTVESIWVQPYTTFVRYEVEVANVEPATEEVTTDAETETVVPTEAAAEVASYPKADVTYDPETLALTLTVNNISADNSEFDYEDTVSVSDSVIDNVLHAIVEGENESYVISLVEEMPYVLHVIEDDDGTKIVLDIMELSREEDEPTPEVTEEPSDDTVDPEVTQEPEVTESPTNTGSTETTFSTGSQTLNTGTSGNVSTITGYNFFDAPSIFTYEYKITGDYPNVEANLDDTNKLTVTIKNLATDNVTGNGGTGHRDFTAVRDVQTLDVTNSSNVSTYVFQLTKSMQYRFVINEDTNRLVLEVKH